MHTADRNTEVLNYGQTPNDMQPPTRNVDARVEDREDSLEKEKKKNSAVSLFFFSSPY